MIDKIKQVYEIETSQQQMKNPFNPSYHKKKDESFSDVLKKIKKYESLKESDCHKIFELSLQEAMLELIS